MTALVIVGLLAAVFVIRLAANNLFDAGKATATRQSREPCRSTSPLPPAELAVSFETAFGVRLTQDGNDYRFRGTAFGGSLTASLQQRGSGTAIALDYAPSTMQPHWLGLIPSGPAYSPSADKYLKVRDSFLRTAKSTAGQR